jgi:integrase
MANIEKRCTSDGTKFRVRVRLKGYPVQTATFKRLTDAKQWAKTTESAILEGRHFKTNQSKKHTLAELIDRYIDDVLPLKPKSKDSQETQLTWWRTEIGDYTLANVTPALIVEHRDKLFNESADDGSKKRTASTVNRYLAALSHAFSVAVNEWGWLEDSPTRKVSKYKEPRGRVRFLSDDERNSLLKACRESTHPHLYKIVLLALATGMRQGEIVGLSWNNIDSKRKKIILHDTKNGERRVIPITNHTEKILKEIKATRNRDTDLLFPSGKMSNGKLRNPPEYKPVEFRKAWGKAVKAAQIDDFRFHDLRHSAASYLAMNGASIAEIAEVLGHKTLAMVKRYTHLSEAHTAGVVERMNNTIFGEA